jgi:acetyl esterase
MLCVYVRLHGGAFIMRQPRMDDLFARFLVARAGVAVLVSGLGLDGSRLTIGGFSAGGNLAASACLQARESGRFRARLQLLGVPSLDVAEKYADKQPVGSPMLDEGIFRLVRATHFRDVTVAPSRSRPRCEPRASPVCRPPWWSLGPTTTSSSATTHHWSWS